MLVLSHNAVVLHLDIFDLSSQVVNLRLAMIDVAAESLQREVSIVVGVC